jgi:hypothetical protein
MLTSTALLCYSYFIPKNLILESTEHTIPSIESSSIVLLNISESFPSQVTLCSALISVSVLNLHEDERQKPENWIPIGWMPCFDDEKARTLRPGQGYHDESCNARKHRLFHDCFRQLLVKWDADTRDLQTIVWGDQKRHQTRFFLGGFMDQPVNTKNIVSF